MQYILFWYDHHNARCGDMTSTRGYLLRICIVTTVRHEQLFCRRTGHDGKFIWIVRDADGGAEADYLNCFFWRHDIIKMDKYQNLSKKKYNFDYDEYLQSRACVGMTDYNMKHIIIIIYYALRPTEKTCPAAPTALVYIGTWSVQVLSYYTGWAPNRTYLSNGPLQWGW